MRILPYGDHALLLEVDDLVSVLALDAALDRDPPAGMVDFVPAARTVLLRFQAGTNLAAARRHLDQLVVLDIGTEGRRGEISRGVGIVEIPTTYRGPDLERVAATLNLSAAELILAHTEAAWTVAFCGFAPGFAYLTGTDPRLASVPRRHSPRTRVPAGSVALAGGFSAVYPGASPGGWQLLGHTEVTVFDVEADPSALLRPGARVRFLDRGAAR